MTARRVTARRTSLEKNHAEVVRMIAVDKATAPQVAERFKVRRESVWQFMGRHEDEIAALTKDVDEANKGLAIADVHKRTEWMDKLAQDTLGWIDEHSLTERTVRYDEDGNIAGETLRYRSDAVNALRALLHEAADQLGQLAKNQKDAASAQASATSVVIVQNVPNMFQPREE